MTKPDENVVDNPSPNPTPDLAFSIEVTGAADQSRQGASRKLTLVCEGGGQRGIFAAGVLDSFMQQNFFPFHAMLGASAGAQNLTSYACNQIGYAREAICQYTTSKKFFDPFRFARGGHLVDLDWYFDVINQEMPLDLECGRQRLRHRSLHMSASRCDTLTADYLSFHSGDVYQSIKASSALPLLFRQPVVLGGVEYWDGGVADSLPVEAAHQRGSDCIVVIRSQPVESVNALTRFPKKWRLKGMQKLGSLVDSYVQNYCDAMNFIAHPPVGVKVIDVAPVRSLKSRLLGSSPDMLQHDYQLGQLCGMDFLENHAWRL